MSRVRVDNLDQRHCYDVIVTGDGHSFGYYQPPPRWVDEKPVKQQAFTPQEKQKC